MIADRKPSFIASEKVVSNVISSVDVEQPVNSNAKAISDKISFKRLFIVNSSFFSYCYIIAFLSAISKSFLFCEKALFTYGFLTMMMTSFG